MGNWEYKQVYCIPSDSPNVLNELGGQGWELCAMSENMFYFKRPMKCVNCKNYNKELTHSRYGSDFYDIKCKAHKNLEIKEGCGCEKFKPKN
jgi:hypothetical protein